MAALTSVNKAHLDNILDRIKTVEWRKKPLPLGKHYGYETKNKGGCGKVTGEFEVVENIKVDLFDIACNDPKDLVKKGCVDWGFLDKYAGKQDCLYANIIENAKRYDKPKELSEFYKPFKYDGDGVICGTEKEISDIYEWDCETLFAKKYPNFDFKYSECKDCPKAKDFYRLTRPPQSWCYVEELK